MNILTNLVKMCLNSRNKKRGRICLKCIGILATIFLIGVIGGATYTINNILSNPFKTEIKIQKTE